MQRNAGIRKPRAAYVRDVAAIAHRSDHDVAIQCERHHETIAVVDVLANQIDASGCGGDDIGIAGQSGGSRSDKLG